MISAFCGCSYVAGDGIDNPMVNPDFWVNQVHKKLLGHTKLINVGKGGSNNDEIFQSAVDTIVKHFPKYLFVCWTELLRLNINPGIELYPTRMHWSPGFTNSGDICINPGITITTDYADNIKNRFFDLQHPHYNLVRLLNYCRILDALGKQLDIKVFFVNNLIELDQGYFNYITDTHRLPSQTTELTRQWLNADTRDDEEFFKLYDNIHKEYKDTQGLTCNWLNVDQGFRKYFYIDRATDNLHPGIESNKIYADFLISKLQNQF